MSWDSNIYYNTPEPWVKIAECEWGASYEFDTLCVWQNSETGEIRAAHDSGCCSCPTPFEYYESMDAATKIESVADLLNYLLSRDYAGPMGDYDGNTKGYPDRPAAVARDEQWAEMVARVHRALREDTTIHGVTA